MPNPHKSTIYAIREFRDSVDYVRHQALFVWTMRTEGSTDETLLVFGHEFFAQSVILAEESWPVCAIRLCLLRVHNLRHTKG